MSDKMVVFVRGSGRCGSKTVVNHLGLHPELARIPVNETLPEALIDWTKTCLQGRDPRVTDDVVRAACRAYFTAYGRSLAGRAGVLLHKSTMTAHQLDILLDFWPEARIVYLVRHPLAVVESLINADIFSFQGMYGFRATVANSLLRWFNEINTYLQSAAFGHKRVFQLKFEDVLQNPEQAFGGVYRFLGITDRPEGLRSSPEQYGRRFVLNQRERRWILDACAGVLARLNYSDTDHMSEVPANRAYLLDWYPDRRLATPPPTPDAVELTMLALREAAGRGCRRVGFFGAGYLARLVCPRLADPPVEVAAIFDDDPLLASRTIGGLRVYRLEAASELGVTAIVPLTLVHQLGMIRRWQRLFGRRFPVVPLWDEEGVSEILADESLCGVQSEAGWAAGDRSL